MIEIACSADAAYLPHCCAMLHSLLSRTRARPLRVWFLQGEELPAQGRMRLEGLFTETDVTLQFLSIPDRLLEGFPTQHFHRSCWYRVLLPELLPALDRILYIDADAIVADDLTPLLETKLEGKLFGAVINPLYPFIRNWPLEDFGIIDPHDYLNSGVLLMALDQMRAEGIVSQLRTYAKDHPESRLPEQDALSDLMRGRWLSLHPRWNMQSTLFDLLPEQLPFPRKVVEEALNRPAVIHFTGPFKPWQYLCKHPLRSLYFGHLRSAGWPIEPLEQAGFLYRLIRPLPLAWQWSLILKRPAWQAFRNRIRRMVG